MFDLKQVLYPKAKTALLITALLSSLIFLVCAVRWTTAEVFKARATTLLYSVDQPVDLLRGRALLTRARTLNPYDAEIPLYQAHYASRSLEADPAQAHPPLQNALPFDTFYHQALAIRPHSGHLWAQYARAQFENNRDLETTLATLDTAMELAPYQPAVIITAMQIGLPNWNSLNNSQQQKLSAAIDFLLDKNARKVINISLAHDLTENLRPLLKHPKHIQGLDQALMKKDKRDMARK